MIELKRTKSGYYYIEKDGICAAGGMNKNDATIRFTEMKGQEALEAKLNWRPLSELPSEYFITNRMFVVKGIDVWVSEGVGDYTTDPYCVWRTRGGSYRRWSHTFQPTHFMELPQ